MRHNLFAVLLTSATLFAAGQTAAGVVSLQAASLARGVLRAMFLSKLKVAVALLLGLGIVAWSATRFAGPAVAKVAKVMRRFAPRFGACGAGMKFASPYRIRACDILAHHASAKGGIRISDRVDLLNRRHLR